LKDYYQILRISRQASEGEVKRAYRRLAIVFHPDKNQSPESLSLFQEINEAHEILSDPFKRQQYDQVFFGSFIIEEATPPQPWHRDPAYRRRQQAGYKAPPPRPSDRLLMMVHLLKYLRIISFAGVAWCAFLIFDYLLPFRISVEKVIPENNRVISWEFHHVPNVVVTDKGHQFPVPFEGVDYFPVGSQVAVVSSRLLGVLVKVEGRENGYIIDNLATVYQNFILAPIILLLLSIVGLVMKQGIELRFNVGIAICIVLIFNIVFLLFSIL
jgi:hypothetical protein